MPRCENAPSATVVPTSRVPSVAAKRPGDDFEQRRLAGTVRADDAEPLPRVERQLDAAEQPRAVAVAVTDAVQVDGVVAEPWRAEPEVEVALASGPLGAPLDDRGRRRDAGLRLARACRRAAPQPGQLGPRQVAADPFLAGGERLALGARLQVAGVPAGVDVAHGRGRAPGSASSHGRARGDRATPARARRGAPRGAPRARRWHRCRGGSSARRGSAARRRRTHRAVRRRRGHGPGRRAWSPRPTAWRSGRRSGRRGRACRGSPPRPTSDR